MIRRHVATPWLLLGVLTCTRGLDAQASGLKLTTNAHGVAREISAFLPNRGDELLPEFGTGERVVMELDKEFSGRTDGGGVSDPSHH